MIRARTPTHPAVGLARSSPSNALQLYKFEANCRFSRGGHQHSIRPKSGLPSFNYDITSMDHPGVAREKDPRAPPMNDFRADAVLRPSLKNNEMQCSEIRRRRLFLNKRYPFYIRNLYIHLSTLSTGHGRIIVSCN